MARRLATWLLTSSMACSSLNRLARAWATRPRTWASAAARSASAAATAAFLIVDLDLVRLLVELDQQVPLLHAVVVVHQDPAHLAGDPGGHEGHVAVDVGVIGGDRVQHRLHRWDQEVSPDRQAGHGPRQQQPFSPGVRWSPCRGRRRGGKRSARRVRGLGGPDGRRHRAVRQAQRSPAGEATGDVGRASLADSERQPSFISMVVLLDQEVDTRRTWRGPYPQGPGDSWASRQCKSRARPHILASDIAESGCGLVDSMTRRGPIPGAHDPELGDPVPHPPITRPAASLSPRIGCAP